MDFLTIKEHQLSDGGFYVVRDEPHRLARHECTPHAIPRAVDFEHLEHAAAWFKAHTYPRLFKGDYRTLTARQFKRMVLERTGIEVSLGAVIQAAHDHGLRVKPFGAGARIRTSRKTIDQHRLFKEFQ